MSLPSIHPVKVLQWTLGETGHYTGPMDGVWGPMMDAAARRFRDDMNPPAPAEPTPQLTGKRKLSPDGQALVKHFESLFLKAYKDPVGIWTIGWGHTGLQHKDGTVFPGRVISPEKAQELFEYDMDQFERRVESLVTVPLNDDEFGALVSFDFNTGALHKATLLKRLNAERRTEAADEFLKWDKAGGQTLRGLTRRRKSERNLFLGKRPFLVT